ncbi:primosomal protein I [Rathayibacter phage NCPPB3778]|nr:primosomal protein I [Rathayibacter phage NCPPB3778]
MSKKRMIKPEFFSSQGTSIASLPARLLYIAMWTEADDHGVGPGLPLTLLAHAFPFDQEEEYAKVKNFPHIAENISDAYGVIWYRVGGRDYYYIPSWTDHQQLLRPAAPKNPFPDAAYSFLYGSEVNFSEDMEFIAAPVAKKTRGKSPIGYTPEFERFWSAFPKKAGKDDAYHKWIAVLQSSPDVSPEDLIAGAERYSRLDSRVIEAREKGEWKYVKMAQGWLTDGRWKDEYPDPIRSQETRPEVDRPPTPGWMKAE